MHGPDRDPLGPEIAGALMAVDATLAGEPADPEYAELAELALILRDEAPRPSDTFAARLDERVERRFARPAPAARGTGLRRWLGGSLAGLAAAAAATAIVVVVANSPGGSVNSSAESSSSSAAVGTAAAGTSSAAAAPSVVPDAKRVPQTLGLPHRSASGANSSSTSAAASASGASGAAASSASGSVVPTPVMPGKRQVVQSAQVVLGVSPGHVDDVSQQVFNVVGQEKGYVNSSNVTSGGGAAGASFQLSVPSGNLSATLTGLSQLQGAHVVSRTDNTNDITGQVGGAGEKLADARALRRSLLKQLAAATTTAEIDSLQTRIHDANASIASDLSRLRGLKRQVAYSTVSVHIQVGNAPAPVAHHSSGFTIGGAAHDAGRVLVVVAGVGLIVLAVLVPLGLVVALAAWVGFAVRRRRREHALDLV